MTAPREAGRAWVERALIASCPEETRADVRMLKEYADSLCAIAEEHSIPEGTLVFWIEDRKGDVTLGDWREFAEHYEASAARSRAADDNPPRGCVYCFAVVGQRDDGKWFCGKCGNVWLNPPLKLEG